MSFGEHFREGSGGAGRAQGSSGQAVPSWGWHSRAELLYHVQDKSVINDWANGVPQVCV